MEPIPNHQVNTFYDYRNTPLRFPHCIGYIKKLFGYQSDQEVPWIFRNIPDAKEKCISIQISQITGVTIKFLKYRNRRDAIFMRMQQGKRVEGYFESNTFSSAKGYFFNRQIYRDFLEIQQETINFPTDMSPMNMRMHSLGLLCDGDNFLIPRELYTGRVNPDLGLSFLSEIAMEYLLIPKNFRNIAYFDHFINRFTETVVPSREVVLHFARMEHSGEQKLAYVVFSESLYFMNFLHQSFMERLSLENALRNEEEEIRNLPRMSPVSLFTDFTIDIDFQTYSLVQTVNGLLAVLNIENFLDQLDEDYINENEPFAPIPRNDAYESCDIFLFKSAWRYFTIDERIPEDCIICFKKFKDNDQVKRFACQRHVYHTACINKWVLNHDTCPLCKYKLSDGLAVDKDAEFLRKKRNSH